MALIDRVFHDDPDPDRHLANHAFSAAVWFWAKGDVTRQNVIDSFNMTVEDEVQLDQLEAHYISLSVDDRRTFHADLESAGILAEGGLITKALYETLLGLA